MLTVRFKQNHKKIYTQGMEYELPEPIAKLLEKRDILVITDEQYRSREMRASRNSRHGYVAK